MEARDSFKNLTIRHCNRIYRFLEFPKYGLILIKKKKEKLMGLSHFNYLYIFVQNAPLNLTYL